MADKASMKETSHGSSREDRNEERFEGSNDDKEMSNASGSKEEVDKEGNMKLKSSNAKSQCRTQVLTVMCGYPGCDAEPMLMKNLKTHTQRRHNQMKTITKATVSIERFFEGSAKRKIESGDSGSSQKMKYQENKPPASDVFLHNTVSESGEDMLDVNYNGENKTEGNTKLLKMISTQVEKIVSKVVPNLDLSECKTEEDVVFKSLGAIQATVNLTENIASLKEAMEIFEEKAGIKTKPKDQEKPEGASINMKSLDELISEARSVKEILSKVPEFEHRPETSGKEIVCVVCQTTFSYDNKLKQDFTDNSLQSEKFRNTKKNLRHHLDSNTHTAMLKEDEVKSVLWAKEEKRNKAVGLVLGRIVYYIVHKGRPDTDFPLLVYLSAAGGTDCGDINHSFHFVSSLLPDLAAAVRRRLKRMLETRLEATGELPPVNLIADKATHQRETRQLVGGITVNPGGSELLTALLFGIPKCAGGSGNDLAESVIRGSDSFVQPSQVVRISHRMNMVVFLNV